MQDFNGKGMTKQAFEHLKKTFPSTRPKLGESLEQIHRREGALDVLSYIERYLVS